MGQLRVRILPPESGPEAWYALREWIIKRPNFHAEDYYAGQSWQEATRMLEREKKQSTRARNKALELLNTAMMQPYSREELAHACRSAYNGRVYWDAAGEIDYCPGQNGTTEYRHAAIAVLDSYLAYVRDLPQYHNGTEWTYGTDPAIVLDTAAQQ